MTKPTVCVDCSTPLPQRNGPGRPKKRCNTCRPLAKYGPYGAAEAITCAVCDKPLRGRVTKPQGQATCVAHRSRARSLLNQCATCGRMYETNRSTAKYCGPECSPWTKKSRHPRIALNLGARHQQIRRAFAILVAGGQELCCICSDPIESDDQWDLDHTPDREGYRGAAHAKCNRSEGAQRAHASRSSGELRQFLSTPAA